MITLVSRRTLPGIRLDLFAAFLDGLRYDVEIRRINTPDEAQEFATRRSGRHCETAGKVQELPLLRGVKPFHLLDNLVFNGLCHNKNNLGKGALHVKGAGPRRYA